MYPTICIHRLRKGGKCERQHCAASQPALQVGCDSEIMNAQWHRSCERPHSPLGREQPCQLLPSITAFGFSAHHSTSKCTLGKLIFIPPLK